MYKKKLILRQLTALLLTTTFILSGCSSSNTQSTPEQTAETAKNTPDAESASPSTSADKELSDSEQFEQIITDIFYDTVTDNGISLHYTLAEPEAYGITEFPDTFGNADRENFDKNYAEAKEIYEQLLSIDMAELSEEQQLDYEILKTYLEADQAGEDFYLYGYALTSSEGIQVQLPILMAEYVFYEKEDIDNYLALLSDIDEYYAQIMDYTNAQAEAGIYMSDPSIDEAIGACEGYLENPENGFMAETFISRLDSIPDLTDDERSAYIAQNQQILREDFTNAYTLLVDGLEALKGNLEQPVGLASLPEGKEYYEYLLDTTTFTSYDSPTELKTAIQNHLVECIQQTAMLTSYYPDILDQYGTFQYTISDPEGSIEDLKIKIQKDYPEVPEYNYTIQEVPKALQSYMNPAFYLTPPIDRSDDNHIYVNPSQLGGGTALYPVMAHEGYPGHLYQINYFNSVNDSQFRSILDFACYTEGWATYVEYQSYQWADGITPELTALFQMDSASTMALSALLDYYINYEGWDLTQVEDFLTGNFTEAAASSASSIYQYICDNPVTYMKYFVGYLEITEMRTYAEETLGTEFDLKEFHTFLLDFGPAPFDTIWLHLNAWLETH